MDYWIFSDEELDKITDLMVEKLQCYPDNSELSVMQLFARTLQPSYVATPEECVSGIKLEDVKLANGKYLHELIEWDFENAIWDDCVGQAFDLLEIFYKKVKKAGFIIDGSKNAGLCLGLPQNIEVVFRKKINFINSFKDEAEETICDEGGSYFVKKKTEQRHYHYESEEEGSNDFDSFADLQLWRVPVGSSIKKQVGNDSRISIEDLGGRCRIKTSHWAYGIFYPDKEASWRESCEVLNLCANKSAYVEGNEDWHDSVPPEVAYFEITNTGKSEVLLYVTDANDTKTT